MSVWKDKKRDWWIAKFQHHGRQIKKEGFRTKREAQQWEIGEKERIARLSKMTPGISFQELATDYLMNCRPSIQPNTIRQKAFVFRSFLGFVGGNLPVLSVTTKQLSDFLNDRAFHSGNKAANRHLRDIKALFNWAIETDVINCKNPCKGIEKFPEDPYTPYVPPTEDIDKIRLVADRDERDFIETIYHLMARRSEASKLTWEDINFDQRWVKLYTRKRRGGELQEDYMPMDQTLYEFLYGRWKRRDKTNPCVFSFNQYQLRHMLKKLCKKANVKPFGFHAIRHHVASILNDSKKASMKQIQKLLRHRRQSTTETYLNLIEGSLFEAVSILDEKAKQSSTLNSTPSLKIVEGGS